MDELITNPPEIHIAEREPPSEYDYLGTDHMIKPKGDYPIMEAHSVSVDDRMVDEVLADLQQAQSSFDSQITEMQSQISALGKTIKIKGRVNTVNDLPGTASEGDMYFVGAETAESFDEYVYTAQKRWEYLGSINDVDLSDYVTKTFLANQLTGYAKTSDIPAAVTESTVSGWGFTKNSGTYSKPSGGIPKTDLASTVQTSLSNADDALSKINALFTKIN